MDQEFCVAHGLPTTQGTSFCSYECQLQDYLQYQSESSTDESMEFADIFEYNEDYQDENGCNYNYTYPKLDSSSLLGSELDATLDTQDEDIEDDSTFNVILYECVWCNEHHLLSDPCKAMHHQQSTPAHFTENILSKNNQLIQSNYQKWLSLSVN